MHLLYLTAYVELDFNTLEQLRFTHLFQILYKSYLDTGGELQWYA